jgi:hypothetical protein
MAIKFKLKYFSKIILQSVEIKEPTTYASYFNKNNTLTIFVNSNKLINFELLGILKQLCDPKSSGEPGAYIKK